MNSIPIADFSSARLYFKICRCITLSLFKRGPQSFPLEKLMRRSMALLSAVFVLLLLASTAAAQDKAALQERLAEMKES